MPSRRKDAESFRARMAFLEHSVARDILRAPSSGRSHASCLALAQVSREVARMQTVSYCQHESSSLQSRQTPPYHKVEPLRLQPVRVVQPLQKEGEGAPSACTPCPSICRSQRILPPALRDGSSLLRRESTQATCLVAPVAPHLAPRFVCVAITHCETTSVG